jgi:hypothetical protein
MKKFLGFTLLAVLLVCILLIKPGFAEFKYSWGPYLRLRHEYWRNTSDMNNQAKDNRSFFRLKSSIWGKVDSDEDLSLYGKLTNEFRSYTYLGGSTSAVPDKSADKKGYHFDINEVVLENFYLDVKNFLELPVDLRLGRQDFIGPDSYGECFLIADGTPGDGSRTFYFNAVKASWRMDEKNILDFIYINDPRDEEYLPIINRVELVRVSSPGSDRALQPLNATDEEAYVLYWKNKSYKDLLLEGYYIFKKEAEEGGSGYQAAKGKINTIGSFAKYNLKDWILRAQLARQFGDYGTVDRSALGGYAFADYKFKDAFWKPQVSLGYIYLSGDDQSTSKKEGWDPLFNRTPWFSDVVGYTYSKETVVSSYWTNLKMIRATLTLNPNGKTKLTFGYNLLRADKQVAASTIFSGSGKNRGNVIQGKIEYAFNKNVSTYIFAEIFNFKNFYVSGADPAVFIKTELQIKF